MPNWTSNTLKAPVEVLKKYIRKDKDGSDFFDFNLVIPRPEIYSDPDLVSGGHQDAAIYWYRSERGTKVPEKISMSHTIGFSPIYERILYEKINGICSWARDDANVFGRDPYLFGKDPDEIYEIGRKYMEAYERYGFLDWYDWDNANWGTKWNACDSDCSHVDEGLITFNTAWSMPEPIIKKIMLDNHDCEISITWRDEDYDGTRTFWHDGHGGYHNKTEWEDEYAYHDEDEDAER